MTQMFFIAAETEDHTNYDLFVEAVNAQEAIALWEEWVKGTFCLKTFTHKEFIEAGDNRFAVFIVPPVTHRSRVLHWHSSEGIEQASSKYRFKVTKSVIEVHRYTTEVEADSAEDALAIARIDSAINWCESTITELDDQTTFDITGEERLA